MGQTSAILFGKVITLPPFGIWNVITYRYADGTSAATNDPPDLKRLVGSHLLFNFEVIRLEGKTCAEPSLEFRTISDDEFVKRTGSHLSSLGIKTENLDVISLKCKQGHSDLQQTFFLRLSQGKLLLLWEGVLLELESPNGDLGTSLLKLITK